MKKWWNKLDLEGKNIVTLLSIVTGLAIYLIMTYN